MSIKAQQSQTAIGSPGTAECQPCCTRQTWWSCGPWPCPW